MHRIAQTSRRRNRRNEQKRTKKTREREFKDEDKDKNPQTKDPMTIVLIHYQAKLLNKEEIKPIEPIKEVKWLNIEEIKQGKHEVAPNIKFLIEKKDIN